MLYSKKKDYLSKKCGQKEGPEKVVGHLKHLAEHGVGERQLSDHQQGFLCIEETAEVATTALKNINYSASHLVCIEIFMTLLD